MGNVLQQPPLGCKELLHPVRHLIESPGHIADAVVAPRANSCRQIAYSKTPHDFGQLIQGRGKLDRQSPTKDRDRAQEEQVIIGK